MMIMDEKLKMEYDKLCKRFARDSKSLKTVNKTIEHLECAKKYFESYEESLRTYTRGANRIERSVVIMCIERELNELTELSEHWSENCKREVKAIIRFLKENENRIKDGENDG